MKSNIEKLHPNHRLVKDGMSYRVDDLPGNAVAYVDHIPANNNDYIAFTSGGYCFTREAFYALGEALWPTPPVPAWAVEIGEAR